MVSVKYILAAVVVQVAASMVRADMVPLSDRDAGSQGTTIAVWDCPFQPVLDESALFSCLVAVGLDRLTVGPLIDAQAGIGHGDTSQPLCILADQKDSLGLCSYALVGLGLCRAATCVKLLSVGVVPGWCRDGGPFPTVHRLDLSPDGLHPSLVYCLVPSGCETHDAPPRYRQERIVLLWRESQFIPAVVGSRGPPSVDCESPAA